MMRHCSKLIPEELAIPRVRLDPQTLSIFTRQQTQPDRICTLESIVLMLKVQKFEKLNLISLGVRRITRKSRSSA